MSYKHGMEVQENPTSITPAVKSNFCSIVIGTAPINLLENPKEAVNKPILLYSFKEAVENLGYSKDWSKFTLGQSLDASFKMFKIAPIVAINVLDPLKHISESISKDVQLLDNIALIKEEGILKSEVIVKSDIDTTCTLNTDYSLDFNTEGFLEIKRLEDGGIPADTSSLKIEFKKLDSSQVTTEEVNIAIEKVKEVYPRYNLIPSVISAPGYSHSADIAQSLNNISRKVNELFNCTPVIDLSANSYTDAVTEKNKQLLNNSIVCWPKVKVNDRVYYYSAIISALLMKVSIDNDDIPYKSPSNKLIPISAAVLEDNTEIFIEYSQANYLNSNGILTLLRLNGWRTWGNNTAAYPQITDPKDRFISIRRFMDWWGNTFIVNYFNKVDDPSNLRLIESIVDSENIRANSFIQNGIVAGAKLEFRKEDNPTSEILDGNIKFIQKIAAFPPAKSITCLLEFDPNMLGGAN